MTRLGDVLHFLRQIFFPNWISREDDEEPTGLQKILAAISRYLSSRNGTGTLFSIILHAFILAVLALIMIPKGNGLTGIDILGGFHIPGAEQPINIGHANDEPETNGDPQNVTENDATSTSPDATDQVKQPTVVPITDPGTESIADSPGEAQLQVQAKGGFVSGGGFQNRTSAGRQRAIQNGGACQRGEDAIEAALKWFAAHQLPDGGWSLYFDDSCKQCSHSGTGLSNRRTAATALALLAFLGAGYSHQTPGEYQAVVDKGLRFLIKDPTFGIDGIRIQNDGLRMYSHGLAAIALCEAHAMAKTQDVELYVASQKALWFIESAQTDYGGWNYRPLQDTRDDGGLGGDTSIFSWQLIALKSGKVGGLHVSQSVLYAAQDFLDAVALDGGRGYQYTPNGVWDGVRGDDSPKTCTAIGLLARMYLGWKPGDVYLDDGMAQIVRWGYTPKAGAVNLYYAYHSTLALHHYGGDGWDDWNRSVRELLIQSQSHQGCESGSWYHSDSYCDSGGRLLNTALAVMILETPYRYMPLYREIVR